MQNIFSCLFVNLWFTRKGWQSDLLQYMLFHPIFLIQTSCLLLPLKKLKSTIFKAYRDWWLFFEIILIPRYVYRVTQSRMCGRFTIEILIELLTLPTARNVFDIFLQCLSRSLSLCFSPSLSFYQHLRRSERIRIPDPAQPKLNIFKDSQVPIRVIFLFLLPRCCCCCFCCMAKIRRGVDMF